MWGAVHIFPLSSRLLCQTDFWLSTSSTYWIPRQHCVLKTSEIQVKENRTLSANTLTHRRREAELLSFSTPPACHHPPAREIPFLLACLVGKRLEMRVYLLISHQWGKLQRLFPFLPAHDTQPVFFGLAMPQVLAAKFFGSTLKWLRNSFRHFNMSKKTDYCIRKLLLWRCAHTGCTRGSQTGDVLHPSWEKID